MKKRDSKERERQLRARAKKLRKQFDGPLSDTVRSMSSNALSRALGQR